MLLTAGAAAALFLVALLHSDGEILVGRPCYPPMLDAVRGVGARVVTVSARFEDGYETGGQLEKGLEVIWDALRWCATASSAGPENAAGGV